MIKHFLVISPLLILSAVGSLPAQAQNSAPAPTAPAPAPTQVSQDELKKFASAIKKMLVISQETDNQMVQVVKQSGLTEARFNEIYSSKQDPAQKPKNPITPKEQQSYDQAMEKLTVIEQDARTKLDSSIKSEGLEPQRFNQIFAAVQKNPQLRQEVQKMLQSQ
jgi:hypothetical protein